MTDLLTDAKEFSFFSPNSKAASGLKEEEMLCAVTSVAL